MAGQGRSEWAVNKPICPEVQNNSICLACLWQGAGPLRARMASSGEHLKEAGGEDWKAHFQVHETEAGTGLRPESTHPGVKFPALPHLLCGLGEII